ncbi:unnamed protein product, partial [Ixodes persulcatus]
CNRTRRTRALTHVRLVLRLRVDGRRGAVAATASLASARSSFCSGSASRKTRSVCATGGVRCCLCCSKTDFARSPLELPVDTAAVVDAVLFNVRCPAVSGGGVCLGRVLCGPCVRIWPSRCCCR